MGSRLTRWLLHCIAFRAVTFRLNSFCFRSIVLLLLPFVAAVPELTSAQIPGASNEENLEVGKARLEEVRKKADQLAAQVRNDVKERESRIPKRVDTTVIAHYRGQGGTPLERNVPDSFKKDFASAVEKAKAEARSRPFSLEEYLKERKEASRISVFDRCSDKTTQRKLFQPKKGTVDSRSAGVQDVLFLRKEDLTTIELMPYGMSPLILAVDNPESGFSHLAESLGVTCVPYRIRQVGGVEFRHMGVDALKNFDKDPRGGGVLAPEVKAIVKDRKVGERR